MRRLLKRASGLAVIGLGATLLPLLAASPASATPGPQPAPTVTPNPVATAAGNFTLSNGTCDGTGGEGWRVQTFIVNDGVDVGSLAFDQGVTFDRVGNDRDNSDNTIASPLWKDNAPGTAYIPAGSPAGLINPTDLSAFDFSNSGWVLTDGPYQIGYVCLDPLSIVSQVWSVEVTIDTTPGGGTSFMTVGTPAPTPVIDSVNVDNGEVVIDFTGTDADSFTAEATTVAGDYSSPVGTATTVSDDTSSISITGLTNGTPYFVRVLANKAGFSPTPSSESGPHVTETNGGAVLDLTITASGEDDAGSGPFVDVDWNAPAAVGTCSVDSYTVDSSPAGTAVQPDPSPTGTGTESARVTGISTNQTITITVTPVFAPGCTGTPASVQEFIATGNIVIQDIDVTRPIGALVLTQVCGTNGALPAEGAGAALTFLDPDGTTDTPGTLDGEDLSSAPPGFGAPGALPAIPADNPSTVGAPYFVTGAGHAPKLTVDPPGGTPTDQSGNDPAYGAGEYPYPTDNHGVANPAPETHCGLDLGVAEFVTQGAGAGQYFAADAAINQVTIVDTRNVDEGWDVTGEMEPFVASSLAGGAGDGPAVDTFSGDFLGWTPVVSEDTAAFDSDADGTADYDQQVVAGRVIEPGDSTGLADGETLASTAGGSGLGTAILDARVKLLIPVTADAGVYEGSLRFSAL